MSLLEDFGRGLQGAGEVLSPDVYAKNAAERREVAANALPNMLNALRVAKAQREAIADRTFIAEITKRGVNPGMTSSAMLDATKDIDPEAMLGPAGQQFLQGVDLRQKREQAVEAQRVRLQAAQDRLNQPTEHVVNGKLVRSYADGRMETIDLPAASPAGGNIRYSISPKDYTPASLKKYGETRNVGDLVAVKQPASQTPAADSPLGNDPNFWYEYYDKTGKLPPMAWGAAGNPTREQFLKGFPQWKQEHGGGASSTAASQAQFKADAGALNAVTKDLNTFEPYKKMLDTNADIAIELGKKIYTTDSALANKPINWFRQNATSNPDFAEYAAQMRFVQTEAARVINNPRIVGQLTDEARKEMDRVISGNAPIAVVERVLKRLKTDGENRFGAMRSQQAEIVARMKGKGTGSSGDPAGNVVNWSDLK